MITATSIVLVSIAGAGLVVAIVKAIKACKAKKAAVKPKAKRARKK
jgi:hypothetical protein